ncbi:Hydrogenase transcriptional regulatory protein hupR1 [Pseudoalteromonas sp. P1-9]|uniref:response regulator n=1 Tax=Pseudoalteromonas sp. P1-9 TaxID=1710354 RepID=UPI0006D5D768|nr:response regulator [Pseudoalteromonas sp. P1-9]KPV94200.1 Hydrogenase transcriptional regulatory protein hupR1 [Pseudoalteromonas sp. P1-9]
MAHILLVDDEPEVTNAIARLLRKDYAITKCSEPENALEIVKQNDIDLVLSDIRMPVIDGVELLSQVKAYDPDIGRVLLSGYSDMELCQRAITDDIASIILAKPWDNFELKNVLRLVLNARKLQKENTELRQKLNQLSLTSQ